jgi:hypothetical protein
MLSLFEGAKMRLTPKAVYRWWREDRTKQHAAKAEQDLARVQERARKAQSTQGIPPLDGGGTGSL